MAEFVRHAVTRMHIKRSIAASLAMGQFVRSVLRRRSKLKFAASDVSQRTSERKGLVHKWRPEQFGKAI